MTTDETPPASHKRRPRYRGTHPRNFGEKYKEHDPEKYIEDVHHIISRGQTPAGMHRPICVDEIITVLQPKPGDVMFDATLGYGGHARELLSRIHPGGKLYAVDVDPIELVKTEQRLRGEGYDADALVIRKMNFAGIVKAGAAKPRILSNQGRRPVLWKTLCNNCGNIIEVRLRKAAGRRNSR
jgi:16S rRNA (cytosine1402-N4)-methyltransferase